MIDDALLRLASGAATDEVMLLASVEVVRLVTDGAAARRRGEAHLSRLSTVAPPTACVCMARAYDLFERRAGRWGLVFREPIYAMGYRHLAYLQTRLGYAVRRDLPDRKGQARSGQSTGHRSTMRLVCE